MHVIFLDIDSFFTNLLLSSHERGSEIGLRGQIDKICVIVFPCMYFPL